MDSSPAAVETATPSVAAGEGRLGQIRVLRVEAERAGWAQVGRELARAASTNGLLVYASAISFRVVFALLPLLLFAVALLGFLGIEEVWRESVAPEIRERTSDAAFTLIDRTVLRVLEAKEGFWLTAGAALALWETSAALRITMRALDRIYDAPVRRSAAERLGVSLALSLPVAACLLVAIAAVHVVPPLLEGRAGSAGEALGVVLGWGLGAVLVALAVALVVRYGSSSRQPFQLVGAATVLVVSSWGVASLLFGVYATRLASYGSVFGGLAFVIILLTYVYLSAAMFVASLQVDAFLRRLSGPGAAGVDGNEDRRRDPV